MNSLNWPIFYVFLILRDEWVWEEDGVLLTAPLPRHDALAPRHHPDVPAAARQQAVRRRLYVAELVN